MKKTFTVNLNGTIFNIDEDAYCLLDEYLCNLRLHFRKQEGAEEIVNDIESRISELFTEKITDGSQVITIAYVEEVITRMGKPEELAGEENEYESASAYTASGKSKDTNYSYKRLYRNPDDKILGGVLGGVAAFFGWNSTLLRLIVLMLLIFSIGTMTVIYLVCWLIVPEARTAAEKLNMRGEEVNVENIGKIVKDGFDKMSDNVNNYIDSGKPRSFFQKLADVFVSVIGVLLKICLVIFIIVCSPVLFVLVIVFIVLVVAIIATAVGGGALLYNMLPAVDWSLVSASPVAAIVACITGVLMVGIPLAGLVYAILKQLFDWQPMASGLKWTLFFLWIAGLVIFLFSLAQLNWEFPYWGIYI